MCTILVIHEVWITKVVHTLKGTTLTIVLPIALMWNVVFPLLQVKKFVSFQVWATLNAADLYFVEAH